MVGVKKKNKKNPIKETPADRIYLFLVYALVTGVLIVTLYPLLWIVSASISDPQYVASGQMWLYPMGITFEGFELILGNDFIWQGYRNTIFYTIVGTAINLIVTIPVAYALSRPEFLGKNLFMTFLIIPMFIGGGLVPTMLLLQNLGWTNTIWVMIIPGATSLFNIVITRTFFQSTIPREMEEAAIMDGCNDYSMFIRIVLPLSLPIIAVMALFFGVGHWNNWFNALILIRNRALWPLQLVLREILVEQNMGTMGEFGGMDATTAELQIRRQQMAQVMRYGVMIVSTLPIIMVYPFLQKYFVKGVMIGSIKG